MKAAMLISVAFLVVSASAAVPIAPSQSRPVWQQDIAPAGFCDRADDGKQARRHLPFTRHVMFLSDETMAITSFARNERTGLTSRELPGAPCVIKTTFVDTASGAIKNVKVWSNSEDIFDIAPINNGSFAVLDRYGITLYSESLQEIARAQFKPDTASIEGPPPNRKMFPDLNHSYWSLASSPTGKTIVAIHEGGFVAVARYFSTAHLESLGDFKQPSCFPCTASDKLIAYSDFDHVHDVEILHIHTLALDAAGFWSVPVHKCNESAFLNDNLMVVAGLCSYILLVDANAHVVAEKVLDEKAASSKSPQLENGQRIGSQPIPSRDGSRVAISEGRFWGGSVWRDTFPRIKDSHIVVYDVKGLTPVFSLPPGPPVAYGGYAPSPDGERLAVLRDHILSLYLISASPSKAP